MYSADTSSSYGAGGLKTGFFIPIFFFLLAKVFLSLIALRAGFDPFAPETYARWDSGHYLSIATRGYEFERCATGEEWCGNTAWLPGYSLLIRALERGGLSGPVAGLAVANLAHLGLLIRLNFILLRLRRSRTHRLSASVIATFFPGMVYYHAIFPIAVFTFCLLEFLRALENQNTTGACLSGAILSAVYSPGILCAPVAFWAYVLRAGSPLPVRILRGCFVAAGVGIGFALALAIQWHDTGSAAGFFLIQSQYGRALEWPPAVLAWLGENLLHSPFRPVRIAAFQSLAVAAGVVGLLWVTRPWRREAGLAGAIGPWLLILFFWIFSLTIGRGISLYRSEACLMPAVVCLLPAAGARLYAWLALPLVVLAALMADLFFRSLLV